MIKSAISMGKSSRAAKLIHVVKTFIQNYLKHQDENINHLTWPAAWLLK
jgi:hypothetical protein